MVKVAGTESGRKRARKPQLAVELSRVNLNTAGNDVGASSHSVAVPADRAEPQVLLIATSGPVEKVSWLCWFQRKAGAKSEPHLVNRKK